MNKDKISRRAFIKGSVALGATSLIGTPLLDNRPLFGHASNNANSTICVATGKDFFSSTIKAVQQLGGMKAFVREGHRVAILANAQRSNPGTFTHPEVLAATIQMCRQAGAKEISCLTLQSEANWDKTGLKAVAAKEGANLVFTDASDVDAFKKIPVPRGKTLKEAMVLKTVFDNDVFINMPIIKDHAGNKFTGTLKNLMGVNGRSSNRTFHKENWRTDINSIAHLDQCIADLNTAITPNLCIVDATEFIITNGPFGPGQIHTPHQIVAGTDRVAIDAYCCQLWDLLPQDIIMIKKAHEHGLGEIDVAKVNLINITT